MVRLGKVRLDIPGNEEILLDGSSEVAERKNREFTFLARIRNDVRNSFVFR
jgi:hypothetical protein